MLEPSKNQEQEKLTADPASRSRALAYAVDYLAKAPPSYADSDMGCYFLKAGEPDAAKTANMLGAAATVKMLVEKARAYVEDPRADWAVIGDEWGHSRHTFRDITEYGNDSLSFFRPLGTFLMELSRADGAWLWSFKCARALKDEANMVLFWELFERRAAKPSLEEANKIIRAACERFLEAVAKDPVLTLDLVAARQELIERFRHSEDQAVFP